MSVVGSLYVCGDLVCSDRQQIQTGFQVCGDVGGETAFYGSQRFHWALQEVSVGCEATSQRWHELRKSMPIHEWIITWWRRECSVADTVRDRKHEVLVPTPCSATTSLCDPGKVALHLFTLFFQLQNAAIHPFPIYRATHEIQVMGITTI